MPTNKTAKCAKTAQSSKEDRSHRTPLQQQFVHPAMVFCVINRMSGNISLLKKGGALWTLSVDIHLLVYCRVRNLWHLPIVRHSVSLCPSTENDTFTQSALLWLSQLERKVEAPECFAVATPSVFAVLQESCDMKRVATGKPRYSATLCLSQFLAVYREWR